MTDDAEACRAVPVDGKADTEGSDPNFISSAERPCAACGIPTSQVEVNFEANLHPRCAAQLWREYGAALQQGAGASESPPPHHPATLPAVAGPPPDGEGGRR